MNAHFSLPNRGMRWIASGAFHMGAEWSNPKEASVHTVNVSGFLMDEHAFANAVFALFVDATGYRRVANVGLIPPPIGRAVDGHHMAGDLLRSGSRPQWCLGPRIGRIIPVFATGAEGLGVGRRTATPDRHAADVERSCCVPLSPRGGAEAPSYDRRQPTSGSTCKVITGGPYLCATDRPTATGRRRAVRRWLTPPLAISAFDASSEYKRSKRHD
jgi:hypothetical protein